MKMRVSDKKEEIEIYLSELSDMLPSSFAEYKTDLKTKAACERYFEKIVEAVIDLAFLVIKEKKLKLPEDDKRAFEILSERKIIPAHLAEKFKDAKGMRNLIAHKYGDVDDKMVFHSLAEEIDKDVREFLDKVESA